MKSVAVVLSGCGVYDGSEIHEACAALLAIEKAGAKAVVCAPEGPQMHVVNHLAGQPDETQTRDILVEAARIARGDITPLHQMDPQSVDGVVLVGGFGAAKNLSTFAVDGPGCTVNDTLVTFLRALQSAGKPIGAMCIAPAILAKVFGADLQPAITIGNDAGTAEAIAALGANHVDCPADEVVVDAKNGFVTTPAYMTAQTMSEVFTGAEALVTQLMALCKSP